VEINRIFNHETFEQRRDEIHLGETGCDVRVEVSRIRADAAVKNVLAIALLHHRFAIETRGAEQEKADSTDESDNSACI
jgi:hypothetical protein